MKEFKFPSFEEFLRIRKERPSGDNNLILTLGDYKLEMGTFSCQNVKGDYKWKIAVGKHTNVFNIYVQAILDCGTTEIRNEEELKVWYEKAIVDIKKRFRKYFEDAYFNDLPSVEEFLKAGFTQAEIDLLQGKVPLNGNEMDYEKVFRKFCYFAGAKANKELDKAMIKEIMKFSNGTQVQ